MIHIGHVLGAHDDMQTAVLTTLLRVLAAVVVNMCVHFLRLISSWQALPPFLWCLLATSQQSGMFTDLLTAKPPRDDPIYTEMIGTLGLFGTFYMSQQDMDFCAMRLYSNFKQAQVLAFEHTPDLCGCMTVFPVLFIRLLSLSIIRIGGKLMQHL